MSASSAGRGGCQQELIDLCRVGKNLSEAEEGLLCRLVEVVKRHLKDKCLKLIHDSQRDAVLWAFACDATPLKCTTTTVHKESGMAVTRRGKVLCEFLLQQGFVKAKGSTSNYQLAFMFGDILSCSAGKKALNIFSAAATFFPLLRRAGHLGICLQSHCMDRLQFGVLDKLLRQRSQAYYMEGLGPDLGHQATMLELTDWIVGVGCSCHDVQNALKWALGSTKVQQDRWALCELHIVVESLRNSLHLLLTRLPKFLIEHLAFSEKEYDWDAVASFWRLLGAGPTMVETLADMNPWWEGGKLWVSGALQADPDVVEKVSHALMYLIKWRKFSDSRWCTVGPCCRGLLGSLCVGLEAWVSMVRDDKNASDYYLKGASRLSLNMKHYCIFAAVVSYVPDAVLAELLVDDRLARHGARLQKLVMEEISWVGALDAFIWQRFSAVLGGAALPWELCHSALHAGQVARAFMHERIFSAVQGYPWKLAVGNVQENFDALAASDEPHSDSCTHKNRLLLRAGFSRASLAEGVALLAEVPWSSVPVEQAHASAATLHRFHPGYSEEMLATRATLHQCRHLFQDPEQAKEARAQQRLTVMQRKNPAKTSGKHAFLGHLVRSAKEQLPSGTKLPRHVVPQLVAAHTNVFERLPRDQQAAFHEEAQTLAAAKSDAVAADIQHFHDARKLKRARANAEHRTHGVLNRVIETRLGPEDFSAMDAMLSSSDFRMAAVAPLRAAAGAPPRPPPTDVTEALGKCPTLAAPLAVKDVPDWVQTLCRRRDALDRVAFGNSMEEGSRVFFLLYATKNPLQAHFLPMRLKHSVVPCLDALSPERLDELWATWQQYAFTVLEDDPVPGDSLPFHGADEVIVFSEVCFQTAETMATDAEPVALADFLAALPQQRKTTEPKAAKETVEAEAREEMSELIKVFPWMTDYLDEGLASAQAKAAPAPAEAQQDAAQEVTADSVISDVWDALAAKRKEWEEQGILQGEEFTTFLKGGKWCAEQKGKAFDIAVGQAKRGMPLSWCKSHKMNSLASFSLSKYGEGPASTLAVEWCRRMQHFFDLWLNSPGEDYHFSASDMDSYVPTEAFIKLTDTIPHSHPAWARVVAIKALLPAND